MSLMERCSQYTCSSWVAPRGARSAPSNRAAEIGG